MSNLNHIHYEELETNVSLTIHLKINDWGWGQVGRQTVATSGRWNLFSLLVLEEKRDTNKHQHTVRIPPHQRPTSPQVLFNLTANLTFIYCTQCQEDIKNTIQP